MKKVSLADCQAYGSNYSEAGLWNKIKNVARKAGVEVIRMVLILFYELKDPNVGVAEKAAIVGALGYFVVPLDLIPDAIPVVGYADDLSALKAAYDFVRNNITPEVEAKVEKKLKEWF